MKEDIKIYGGLDVHFHKDTITVAVAEAGRQPGRIIGTVPHDLKRLLKVRARRNSGRDRQYPNGQAPANARVTPGRPLRCHSACCRPEWPTGRPGTDPSSRLIAQVHFTPGRGLWDAGYTERAMSARISISDLEQSINRARAAQPASGSESALSAEVSVLADLYGRLIFRGQASLDPDLLSATQKAALLRWLPSSA